MAITILFGPGGSGKSLYQVSIIIRELRESKRNIVTNLALNLGRLNEYLEQTYPNESLNAVERIRILKTVEEMKEFYKIRGPMKWGAGKSGEEYDMKEDAGAHGVAFVIDEAGACGFSAQGWAESVGRSTRGVECSWYLDQQRKFGDNVYASTNGRSPAQIAKAFRDKAHSFIRLKNGYLQTYGMFRAVGQFRALHYAVEPGPSVEPFREEKWKMDPKGIASCYRTQDGVGVAGTNADIGARAKGIDIRWVIPAALLLGLACVVVPYMLAKGSSRFIMRAGGVKTDKAAVTDPKAVQSTHQEKEAPPVYVSSLVNDMHGLELRTTDGRVRRGKELSGLRYDDSGVTLPDGTWLAWRPVTYGPPAQLVAGTHSEKGQ